MPCKHLEHLDKRYRERYSMSMIENLKELEAKGLNEFLVSQQKKYRCPSCGDVVSVHDGKCYSCGYTQRKKRRLK
jgi:rubrerythrin